MKDILQILIADGLVEQEKIGQPTAVAHCARSLARSSPSTAAIDIALIPSSLCYLCCIGVNRFWRILLVSSRYSSIHPHQPVYPHSTVAQSAHFRRPPAVVVSRLRSFPSKAIQSKRTKLDDLQNALTAARDKEKQAKKQLDQALQSRQLTKERKLKMERLGTLRGKKRALDEELKQYEVCDPERLKKLRAGVVVCRDSANRWTENCQLIVQYFKKKGHEVDQGVSH